MIRHTRFRPRVERLEDRTVPSLLPLTGDVLLAPGPASDPSIAAAPDGRYVIAYEVQGATQDTIAAQLFAADGTSLSTEFQVNQDSGRDTAASVGMDAQGNFVIAWSSQGQQTGSSVIEARRFDPTGAPLGDEFQTSQNTSGLASSPSVAMDAAGDFTVTWQLGNTIQARRFSAAGAALGDAFTVTQGQAFRAAAASDATGDVVVTWDLLSNPGVDVSGTVEAQRYNALGAAVGGPIDVGHTDAGTFAVASDSTGNFVVAWDNNGDIDADRFSSGGADLTGVLKVNQSPTFPGPSPMTVPKVASDPQGNFVVAWENAPQRASPFVEPVYADGAGDGVFARSFTAAGQDRSGEFQISEFAGGDQLTPDVAMDAQGNFVAAFVTSTSLTSFQLESRRFTQTSATGFSYDSSTQTLNITGPAGSTFVYRQATFTQTTIIEGHATTSVYQNFAFQVADTPLTYTHSALSQVNVSYANSNDAAYLFTNDMFNILNASQHDTAEVVSLGAHGGAVLRYQNGNGPLTTFIQLSGFSNLFAYVGQADFGMLMGTPGGPNNFVSAGGYSYMNSGPGIGFHYQITGAPTIFAYSADPSDVASQYDGSDASTYTVSGSAYSIMSGTDQGLAFFNEAVGFKTNLGLAFHPRQDIAIFYDSPGNDVFFSSSDLSYLYSDNPDGSLAYYDAAFGGMNAAGQAGPGFNQVYAYSFVGGTDYAYNFDPQHNHTSGFIVLT
jgi:hypothetical protein